MIWNHHRYWRFISDYHRDDEGEVVTLDGAAQIRHGRTFLPFRAIAEAFGAEVDYGFKTRKGGMGEF